MEVARNKISALTLKSFWVVRLPALFRLTAIILGGLHVWAAITRHSMNADGIAYLDIGDAYFQGDLRAALNPVWSPLYSWILGMVLHVVNPPIHWEFATVHLVNFGIYLGTLASFELFWRHVKRCVQARTITGKYITLPDWAWQALGFSLFIWSSLTLIEIWAVTPDMLVAALVYLASGLILRIRSGRSSPGTWILLGIVLGIGYLAKTVMLPIGLVILGVSFLSVGNFRWAALHTPLALIAFLMLCIPFITAISFFKGRVTFGEAGKLTYLRHVNSIPYPHWQGEKPDLGFPLHSTRKLLDEPAVYEFASPVAGTYPVSYDPSYWYEGAIPRFNLDQQVQALLRSGLFYLKLFFQQQGGWIAAILILYLVGKDGLWPSIREIKNWGLALVSLAALGLYALVYVEGRYIAPFLVLLWADLLAGVRLPDTFLARRLSVVLSSVMVFMLFANVVADNLEGFRHFTGGNDLRTSANSQARSPSWPGEVAEQLYRLDIHPGDKVAVIGYAFDSYWARLARVRIVAEMLDWQADDFWSGDSTLQYQVLQAFASTGAKAVVAENVPGYASPAGWHRVGESSYYIYIFDS